MKNINSICFLLILLVACKPEPVLVEPEPEVICFERTEYVDRGPAMPWGDYEVHTPDYSYGFPASHPALPETIVYRMTFYDDDFLNLRYELWWYNLQNGSGQMIYRGKPASNIDLSPSGWIAFSSTQGVAVVNLDGSGFTYLEDGSWMPRWHPMGDTLFLEEAVAYQQDGQWIKKTYAETNYEPKGIPDSPDGKYATSIELGALRTLFIEDLATGRKRQVSLPLGVEPGQAIWASDQAYLYINGRDTTLDPIYSSLLFRVHLETEKVDRLREYDGTNTYRNSDITSDGKHLISARIMTDSVGGGVWHQRHEIWIMDSNGCNERKLELPQE